MVTNNDRADYFRTELSTKSSRSSTILNEEFRRIKKDEQELNTLNHRFENYLSKILKLGEINLQLHRQIDDFHRNHLRSSEPIGRQLNIDFRNLISFQIRQERADYDRKYYQNQLKTCSTSNQLRTVQQQFDGYLNELNLLKKQYENQIKDLRLYKQRYNEYMTTLIDYTDEYERMILERMQSENRLCTVQEQLAFEREYNARCREEWEDLERIQYDQFTEEEFANIVQKIRQDYQQYNEIQISELEVCYQIKLESIKQNEEKKKEDIRPLIDENRLLQQKLKQLKSDLYQIIKGNEKQYEKLNDEYKQLELRLPEFKSSIEISRDDMIHLTSEINTYRCLLSNLVVKKPPSDFTVHFGNGIIWCRI